METGRVGRGCFHRVCACPCAWFSQPGWILASLRFGMVLLVAHVANRCHALRDSVLGLFALIPERYSAVRFLCMWRGGKVFATLMCVAIVCTM